MVLTGAVLTLGAGLRGGLVSVGAALTMGSSTTGAGTGGGMGVTGSVTTGRGTGPKNKVLSHFNIYIAPASHFAKQGFAFGSCYATSCHGIIGRCIFSELLEGKQATFI